MNFRILLLLALTAVAFSGCATSEPLQTESGRKLKLETVDRGPLRPKTYQYRAVE